LAGLVPLNPDAVLSRCKTRKQRPSFDRFLPIAPPDMRRFLLLLTWSTSSSLWQIPLCLLSQKFAKLRA
jgi:hypothetical protein